MSGVLGVGALTVNTCLYNVDGGERAVMYDMLRGGILDDVRSEGTHFMIPFVQRPIVLDVRTRPREIPSVTGTKDLQVSDDIPVWFTKDATLQNLICQTLPLIGIGNIP